MIANSKFTILLIQKDEEFIRGTIIELKKKNEYDMFEFFIEPAHQVQGIVAYALELVENYFEDAKVFRLITPPQVVRNCVFYVNKCGYQIVKVLDFNKGENYEDYLLKK